MSLAEELLADLEDDEEEQEALLAMETDEAGDTEMKESANEWAEKELILSVKSSSEQTLKDVAKLHYSNRLKKVLNQIKEFSGKARKAEELQGPVEADPEYLLIVDANNLAAEIDSEIIKLFWCYKPFYWKMANAWG